MRFAGAGRAFSGLRTARSRRMPAFSAVADMTDRKRIVLLAVVLTLCGGLGLLIALAFAPEGESGALVKRVRNGVTETGKVETVTTPSGVKRVIRWRTRAGKVVTQTVRGPLRVTTLNGQTYYLAGPSHTIFGTTTLPGGTVIVTGPGVTSIVTQPVTTVETLPVTETIRDTVTETVIQTVTDTVVQTVTDTVTQTVTETVTVTVPIPP